MNQERLDKIKRIHPGADRGLIMDTIRELVAEVERLRLVFAFHCKTGTLSLAQTATALNMSQDEVMALTRKLPSPDSRSYAEKESI